MLTPQGWWESRRLPGSGAGPSPDRMVIGSEGILGVITEAWMRIQRRPEYRATAGVTFDSWPAATEAVRQVVQAKLWPANLRVLDPAEAHRAAGLDGTTALLIIGFESADLTQRHNIAQAVEIVRGCGGQVDDEEIRAADGSAAPPGERSRRRGVTPSSASASASTRASGWWPTRSRLPSRGTGGPSSTPSSAIAPARRSARCSVMTRCCRAASRTCTPTARALLHVVGHGSAGLGDLDVGGREARSRRGSSKPGARSPTTTPSVACIVPNTTGSASTSSPAALRRESDPRPRWSANPGVRSTLTPRTVGSPAAVSGRLVTKR